MSTEKSETRRLEPAPQPAVSMVVFRDERVLIVQRAKTPLRGIWSLPGGHIEPGERARDAAHRELAEETGITADLVDIVDAIDVISRHEDGSLRAHYVLIVFCANWLGGEVRADSDVMAARWAELTELPSLEMTDGAEQVIARARSRLRQQNR